MSGSGSGPSYSENSSSQDCTNLQGLGTIMSPVPAILPLLRIGEFLNIEVQSVVGPLLAYTLAGQLVGSVFAPGGLSAAIIGCINDGNDYQGRITDLKGGLCELYITAK